MNKFVIFCSILIGLSAAGKIKELPSFFKTCKVNDPKLSECIIEKSKLTLPGILQGIKDFKVPTFLPLRLKEVKVDAGSVVLKLSDFDLYGLESVELTAVKMDPIKKESTSTLHIKQLHVNGTYDIDGKILIMAIKGNGPAYLQFDNLVLNVEFGYDLIEFPEDKQYHYMKLHTLHVNYTLEHAFFKFDNLFNGDKKMGEEINAFLNENWNEFHKDVKPAIISVIESVINTISSQILELVPIEKMFSN